jgi:hypothetical protein
MTSPKSLSHESGLLVRFHLARVTVPALYLHQGLFTNLATQLVLRIQAFQDLDRSPPAIASQVLTRRRPVGIRIMETMDRLRAAQGLRQTMTGWHASTPGRNKQGLQRKLSRRLHLHHRKVVVRSRHWLLKAPTHTMHPPNLNTVGP